MSARAVNITHYQSGVATILTSKGIAGHSTAKGNRSDIASTTRNTATATSKAIAANHYNLLTKKGVLGKNEFE